MLNHLRARNSFKQHFKKVPRHRNALQGHMNIIRLMLRMEILAACFRNYTSQLIHNTCKIELSGVKGGGVAYITEIAVFTGSKSRYNGNLYFKLKFQEGLKKWYPVLKNVYQFPLHDCQVRSHFSFFLPPPVNLTEKFLPFLCNWRGVSFAIHSHNVINVLYQEITQYTYKLNIY